MQQIMKRTHIATEDKYETLRSRARLAASKALPMIMPNGKGQGVNIKNDVTLSGIDFHACVQAKLWISSLNRRPDIAMSWTEAASKYARTIPKRFELAIWHREVFLCGLALGQPTWSGGKLRLDFIEASPEKNPVSGVITDITIIAAEIYADAIGASELRIMNPINEKVRTHYLHKDRGFKYDQRGDFCFKELI